MSDDSFKFIPNPALFIAAIVGMTALWGIGEAFDYFTQGRKPSLGELPWFVGGLIVVLSGMEIRDHLSKTHKRLEKIEKRLDAVERGSRV